MNSSGLASAGAPRASGAPIRAGAAQGFTISVAAFFPILAIVSLAPAVPSIVHHFAGDPHADTLVPLMVTAPGMMIALCSPLVGWAADRFGRRKMLLVATLVYGFLGIAPLVLDSLQAIFASRFGIGLTEAVILTVTNTLIGDYFTPRQRRKWLTVQGVIGPVFSISVIALSGVLTEYSWRGSFFIYFVAFAVFAAMLVCLYEPTVKVGARGEETANAVHTRFPWPTALACCAVTLFTAVLYYVFIVQGGLAFETIGVHSSSRLGVLIAIAATGVPIGALTFGWLSGRWPIRHLIALYLALFGIGMLGIGFASNEIEMTAFAWLQQVGAGMTVVSLIYWLTSLLPAEHRGRGTGMWVCAFFAGQFVSPLVFGAFAALGGGIPHAFIGMGVLGIAGAVVALMIRGSLGPKTGV
jgi:MFS family permease